MPPLYDKRRAGERGAQTFNNAAAHGTQLSQMATGMQPAFQRGYDQARRNAGIAMGKNNTVLAHQLRMNSRKQDFAESEAALNRAERNEAARQNNIRFWTGQALRERQQKHYEDKSKAALDLNKKQFNKRFNLDKQQQNFYQQSKTKELDQAEAAAQAEGLRELSKNTGGLLSMIEASGYDTTGMVDEEGNLTGLGKRAVGAVQMGLMQGQDLGAALDSGAEMFGGAVDKAEIQRGVDELGNLNLRVGPDSWLNPWSTGEGEAHMDKAVVRKENMEKRDEARAKRIEQRQQQFIQQQEQEAYQWLQENPNHPNAQRVWQDLQQGMGVSQAQEPSGRTAGLSRSSMAMSSPQASANELNNYIRSQGKPLVAVDYGQSTNQVSSRGGLKRIQPTFEEQLEAEEIAAREERARAREAMLERSDPYIINERAKLRGEMGAPVVRPHDRQALLTDLQSNTAEFNRIYGL